MGYIKINPNKDLMGYSDIHRPAIYATLKETLMESTDLHLKDNGIDLVASDRSDFKCVATFRTSFIKVLGESETFCNVRDCAEFIDRKYKQYQKGMSA